MEEKINLPPAKKESILASQKYHFSALLTEVFKDESHIRRLICSLQE